MSSSKVIKMTACTHCDSSDAMAHYDDHTYCFSCGKYTPFKDTETLRKRFNKRFDTNTQEVEVSALEVDSVIPRHALSWLKKYGITDEEITLNGIGWNQDLEILVLLKTDGYYQGRNFKEGSYIKYISKGNKPLTSYGEGDKIILVEDILSAIKVSRQNNGRSIALLGSSLSKQVEDYLLKENKEVYIWLDRDKAKTSIRMKNRLRELGLNCKSIVTELDPKELNCNEIVNYLRKD